MNFLSFTILLLVLLALIPTIRFGPSFICWTFRERRPRFSLVGTALALVILLLVAGILYGVSHPPSPTLINEQIDSSDLSGNFVIKSFKLDPITPTLIFDQNPTAFAEVSLEDLSDEPTFLGLEIRFDSGTLFHVYTHSVGGWADTKLVPPNWVRTISFPLKLPSFFHEGYIELKLAKCPRGKNLILHVPGESEILYEEKFVIVE